MQILTRIEPNSVTLMISGTFNAAGVADFDLALSRARQLDQAIVLDLSRVRLIDRPALSYLVDLLQDDVRLVIFPDYVEHWIYREQARGSPLR